MFFEEVHLLLELFPWSFSGSKSALSHESGPNLFSHNENPPALARMTPSRFEEVQPEAHSRPGICTMSLTRRVSPSEPPPACIAWRYIYIYIYITGVNKEGCFLERCARLVPVRCVCVCATEEFGVYLWSRPSPATLRRVCLLFRDTF